MTDIIATDRLTLRPCERGDADVVARHIEDTHASAPVPRKPGFEVSGDCALPIRARGEGVPGTALRLTRTRWEARQ